MALGGALMRFGQSALRILEFACAAVVLGVFSYFLAVLSRHNIAIPTWEKAVEGMSGAAALYTLFAIFLTLCLGGVAVFGFLAVALDVLFAGCFAAIAYYTRHGANSCRGNVSTPIGNGENSQPAPGAGTYGYVCSLNTACFAVSIIAVFLFLITAAVQILLVRSHKTEKRQHHYSNSHRPHSSRARRRPFWKRNKAPRGTRDAELATTRRSKFY